ncbi:MAG: hypothetical protein JJT99_03660 [Rhodobacteraceae bacterium]|nr:hypothetical protein [Paracoccaceae bacterium]
MIRALHGVSRLAVLGLLLATAPLSGYAQTASHDDLRALRFYISQGDQPAAQAELRRLRAAFPDWRPPSDLNELMAPQSVAQVDEAAIWRRIEQSDYAGARRLISDGRDRVPGWTPPSDMLRVLDLNEAQDSYDAAVQARDAGEAIGIARRAPQIMSCERINNAWQLADMYVLAGQKPAAVTTWRNTIQSCTSFSQMQTTLQKASAEVSQSELRELFDVARRANPSASGQLDRLWSELTGGSAPASAPAASSAAPARASQPASAPSAQPAAPARTAQPAAAAPPSSLPLRGDNRLAEVRRLKEQEQYARCLAASTSPRSLEVLYERAWCAYSHDRPTEALVAFQQAARVGDRLGPNVNRDAHFGMALAYLSMNMTEQGAQVASQVSLSASQRKEVESIVLDQRAVRSFRAEDYRRTIGYLDALERLEGALRRDLAILRAYAYLNAGNRAVAREQFERLHAQLATADTRRGLNAARGN